MPITFNILFKGEINLEENVITESLGTIPRWNMFSRLLNRNKLDCERICEFIETNFEKMISQLNQADETGRSIQRENLKNNLTKMKQKFHKETCNTRINSIINKIEGMSNKGIYIVPPKPNFKTSSTNQQSQPTLSLKPKTQTNNTAPQTKTLKPAITQPNKKPAQTKIVTPLVTNTKYVFDTTEYEKEKSYNSVIDLKTLQENYSTEISNALKNLKENIFGSETLGFSTNIRTKMGSIAIPIKYNPDYNPDHK